MKTIQLTIILLVFTACGRFGNTNSSQQQKQEQRIISASKQYTEFMYALGLDSLLVAVDLSSTYPAKAKELPTVGYHMKLSFEGLVSMNPTLILHHGGKYSIGPEHVVKQLEELQIPMLTFNNKAKTIESTKELLLEMGTYFNKVNRAKQLISKLETDMQLVLQNTENQLDTPNVVVIHYGRANNMYLAVGANSVAGKMVQLAGGKIPINKNGMERITSPEIIAQANPDVILLTDFGYDRLGNPKAILDLPGIALTQAAKNNRIYRVEAHDLIYFGPRTGENILKLKQIIHQPNENQ